MDQQKNFFGHPPARGAITGLAILFWGTACTTSPHPIERFPGPSPPPKEVGSQASQGPEESWAVVLEAIRDRNAEQTAFERAREIGVQTSLPEVRAEFREGRWLVLSGRFAGPQERDAQRTLAQAKQIRFDDRNPFAGAALLPPASIDPSRVPEFDLRSARRGVPRDQGLYTLQIGAYGRLDGKSLSSRERAEVRETAERAVRDLRADGIPAFFLHDANLSVVTVGVFTDDDLGLTPRSRGFASPEFERLKREFPNNLLNGKGLNEPDPANPGQRRLQASQPVEIPR